MEMEEKNFETEETQEGILREYTLLEALEQTMAMAGTAMEKYLEEERGEPMKSAFVIDTKKNMDRAYVGIWHKLSEEKPEEDEVYLCIRSEDDYTWQETLQYYSGKWEDMTDGVEVDDPPIYWSELPALPMNFDENDINGGNE